MADKDPLAHPETRRLRKAFDELLAASPDDAALLHRLEGMATQPRFGLLSWYWAPKLHARAGGRFRSFIGEQLRDGFIDSEQGDWPVFVPLPWKGEVAQALEAWQPLLERDNDLNLLRRLMRWRYRDEKKSWDIDSARCIHDLLQRFAAAGHGAERLRLLTQFDLPLSLTEAAAQQLYATDPEAGRPYILRHLPHRPWRGAKDLRWQGLAQQARQRGDAAFASSLYRRLVPLEVWQRDALALAKAEPDPERLSEGLRQLHPEELWSDLGPGYLALLDARGSAVLPYVQRHLADVRSSGFGRDSAKNLVNYARRHRLPADFWIAVLVQRCQNEDYNHLLLETLNDSQLDAAERRRRLHLFSGVSQEWSYLGWGLARVQPLDEATALALYRHDPQLLREQFKGHVLPAWRTLYGKLFDAAWAADDQELVHHLAARYLTRGHWGGEKEVMAQIELVVERLLALKLDPPAFARRAAAILTHVPAYAVHDYRRLLQHNRLARLLFERALPDFLAAPECLPELVEGAEIHVQRLAYRVLAQNDPRARQSAAAQLPILLGTLLRPLHRETRLHALKALLSAARHDAASAQQVLARARQALRLPDQHYPKEALLGLIAAVLAQWPALAQGSEQPIVYRRNAPQPA